MDQTLFYSIRLVRTALVLACGGALAVSGMVFQSVFQNPLVSPDILGVGSGCAVGAATAILFFGGSMPVLQAAAFFGGILTVYLALLLSARIRGDHVLSMILSGMVLNALTSAFLMAMKVGSDPQGKLPAIEFWLMGGFHRASLADVQAALPLIFFAVMLLYLMRWKLTVLSVGEEEAASLGLSVKPVRLCMLFLATVLVSSVIAVAGMVSWIGLMAPHLVRICAGENIVENFSLSFFCGASLLLFSDILARTLLPMEIPISILTSFFGACFLLYLLLKKGAVSR